MMRACPHHGLEKWLIIHTLYKGLFYNMRMIIDIVAGRALMNKVFIDAYALIDIMAQNHYQWGSERAPVEKIQPKGDIYEVSNFNYMNAKVDALTQKVDNFNITPATTIAILTPKYEIYGVFGHVIANFQLAEPTPYQVNYAQGNPY